MELTDHPDSFRDPDEPKSSKAIWDALREAERILGPYYHLCDRIDAVVSAGSDAIVGGSHYSDQEFDLFWASLEIMKPAVYSRAPQPVVAPRFQDRDKVATTASELLERCLVSSFERGDFDQVMLNVRDDLIVSGRGAVRVRYESDEDGKRVCEDHVDRMDFLHEPARKWSEVGWVAFAGYLTQSEFKKRFPDFDEIRHGSPQYNVRRNPNDTSVIDTAAKCKVWEVWHKADRRVYWVTDGVEVILDQAEPFLKLEGFYPCPRPAYGTLRRRTLIPVPDWVRYEQTLEQINDITRRIHGLLDKVRLRGFIPAGGDVADAVEIAMRQDSDDLFLVPVPGAALTTGSAANFVQFLPLTELAQAIQGLIEARRELINNYYELSGISDIMRGATEAEETLGAQQLKSQYGSIRIRMKIDELQRVARDVARITAEIIAEKFDQDTLLEMAQMTVPTRAEIKKQLKQLEDAAKAEMDGLEKQAQQAMQQAQASGQQIDPQQAEQMFQQAQQAIIAKYQPQIAKIGGQVAIEDIMELLRDQKARAFSIEIETDSTVMADEMAEKQARAEFLTAFGNAIASAQPLLAAGGAGAKLAGVMLKFATAPFRAGRDLDAAIDEFVDEAPQALQQQQGGEAEKAIAEANQKLAEAELQKAQAQTEKVRVEAREKAMMLDQRQQEMAIKAQQDQQRFDLEIADTKGKLDETAARIEKIRADIDLAFAKLGLEQQREERETVKTAAEIDFRQQDQAMAAQNADRDAAFRAREMSRSDMERGG